MDNSSKDLPTPLRSTVSAQARKRATCGEQEVGLSWFSLRQRSNSTNSLEHSCLIFWITGLPENKCWCKLLDANVGARESNGSECTSDVALLWWCALCNLYLHFMARLLPCWGVGGHTWPICLHFFMAVLCSDIHSSLPGKVTDVWKSVSNYRQV